MPVEEFARTLNDFATKTVQLVAKQVAGEAFVELGTRLYEATPVLTGRARRNWQPTVEEPADFSIRDVAGVEETGAPLTEFEKQSLENTVEQFLKDENADKLVIANNLTYIGPLNDGTSAKAPAGFVETAIEETLAVIQDKGRFK